MKLAIVVGSTRPGRRADVVAQWIHDVASRRTDADFEIVDIRDYALPLFDEPTLPSRGQYTHPHTIAWSAKIASFDGYVFVTPEYNHGPPAALKNAIDFLYREWNNKAAAFVSYGGGALGTRAIEQLRLVMAEVQIADVRASVNFSLLTDFENMTVLKPAPRHETQANAMLDQLIAWSGAMKSLRTT